MHPVGRRKVHDSYCGLSFLILRFYFIMDHTSSVLVFLVFWTSEVLVVL